MCWRSGGPLRPIAAPVRAPLWEETLALVGLRQTKPSEPPWHRGNHRRFSGLLAAVALQHVHRIDGHVVTANTVLVHFRLLDISVYGDWTQHYIGPMTLLSLHKMWGFRACRVTAACSGGVGADDPGDNI